MRGRLALILVLLVIALAGCNLGAAVEATLTPPPTPAIPRVEFLNPPPGTRVIEGYDLTLDIVARDDITGIIRLEVFLDGELFRTIEPENAQPVPVFRVETNWFAESIGLHAISAVAYRLGDVPSDEAFLTVEVVSQ
ncbi:MAG: hypothetical protein OHK0046_44350 [Anaerolineae bacterium]